MKLEYLDEFPQRFFGLRKLGKVQALVAEFYSSGKPVCILTDIPWVDIKTGYCLIQNAARRLGLPVNARGIDGQLYMYRTDMAK